MYKVTQLYFFVIIYLRCFESFNLETQMYDKYLYYLNVYSFMLLYVAVKSSIGSYKIVLEDVFPLICG